MYTITDLITAIKQHHLDKVRDIIAAHPELVNAHDLDEQPHLGGWRKSPLMIAAQLGHADIVQLLLQKGADVHQKNNDERCCEGDALYWAIADGSSSPDVVKLLINAGADVNSFNDCLNISALAEAAARGNDVVVKLLLDHGANINHQGPDEWSGTTPLMAAAGGGHLAMVKLLLERGANPLLEDGGDNTARSIALEKGHQEIADLLATQ